MGRGPSPGLMLPKLGWEDLKNTNSLDIADGEGRDFLLSDRTPEGGRGKR